MLCGTMLEIIAGWIWVTGWWCLVAAKAGNGVLRINAAASAIFVLLGTFISPAWALRPNPQLTGRSSANTGGDRKNALIISVSSEVDHSGKRRSVIASPRAHPRPTTDAQSADKPLSNVDP
jgi:hypothetical protein